MKYRNQKDNADIPVIICVSLNLNSVGLLCEALGARRILTPNNYDQSSGSAFGTYEPNMLLQLEKEVLRELGIDGSIPPSFEETVGYTLDPQTLKSMETLGLAALEKTLSDGLADCEKNVNAPLTSTREGEFFFAASGGNLPKAMALILDPLSPMVYIWRKIIRRPLAAILITEDPTSFSADYKSGLAWLDSQVFRLAKYERAVRNALLTFSGLPTLIVEKSAFLPGDGSFAGSVDKLLEICSFSGTRTILSSEQGLAQKKTEGSELYDDQGKSDNGIVLPSQAALYRTCQVNLGLSDELKIENEPENDWTTSVLRLGQDIVHTFAGLNWAVKQIEPILRLPDPGNTALLGKAQLDAIREDGRSPEDIDPMDAKRAYPLNASEDRRAYHRWLRERHLSVNVNDAFSSAYPKKKVRTIKSPLISVLVPVWKTPLWALERCVGSVLNQTFTDFELILCDDASAIPELSTYLNMLPKHDSRIRTITLGENGGISKATNAALAISRGKFIAFLDHDDELELHALEVVAQAIRDNSAVDVIYSDEDKIDAHGERFDPLFKPEWSPDLLLSFAYICHLTVIRRELVMELGGLRSEFDGSQDYDLTLRATEKASQIVHISEVLYHWRTLPGSAAGDSPGTIAKPWAYTAGLRAIKDALDRRKEEGEVTAEPAFPGRYHVARKPKGDPLVSIIIPFRDEPSLLAVCCNSLQQNPGYDNFEFILVDNGSELPETFTLLDKLTSEHNATVINMPGPFNWAKINNAAANKARGEVLLFSNNDIEARSPNWLFAMLGHATRPEVGAVGARLLYPDGGIQHAGVIVGLGGIAGHVLRGLPGQYPGYNSMAIQTRNCSVVTGACMMTRREVFEQVEGFDENLPVAFNDVDFCLKLREKDYLIVYTPLADLIHHESKSRGHTDDLAESARIIERWGHVIVAGDPYLNKHLSHWRYWCPLSTAQENDRWNNYLETSVLTRQSSLSTLEV